MMRESLIAKSLVLALVLAVGAMGWACDGDGGGEDADTDISTDDMIGEDAVLPDVDVTDPIPDGDVLPEVLPDGEPDAEPDTYCPAACRDIPTGGAIGSACASDASCDHAATCISESVESFNGAMYVDLYGSVCWLYGAGDLGCDPEVTTTCPAGAKCVYFFESLGYEYYGCVDACNPVDTSGNMYEYNCGCRKGYECIISDHLEISAIATSPPSGVCFGGCSHDRECCERWWDENPDGNRGTTEVVVKEGCTNTCDNGGIYDDTTPEPEDCTVSYSCVNNGDTSNVWSGPCEGDAWCPPDGRCLDEFHYRDETVDPPEIYYPGGVCIKDACHYAGRGCSDYEGACANLGYVDDPFYTCVGTCHFGRAITDAEYECRTTEGQEQACVPAEDDFWKIAPTDGSDGFCWSGYNVGGDKGIGEPCEDESECTSPLGVGFCLEFSAIPMDSPYCSIQCNAANANLCGEDDGTGVSTGACIYGYCWEGCPVPGANLEENGCSSTGNACWDPMYIAEVSDIHVPTGLTAPPGWCFPRCVDDAWCAAMFTTAMSCNTANGICGG